MHPNIVLYWPAIGVSTLAGFVFGWIWYGPLFGKTWAKLMGISMGGKTKASKMMKPLFLQALSLFLMVYVLAHSVQVWRASVWHAGKDGSNAMYGFYCGLFTWLGFFVPMQLHKIAWEMKRWKLFWLNSIYDFALLQILSQILAHWRK